MSLSWASLAWGPYLECSRPVLICGIQRKFCESQVDTVGNHTKKSRQWVEHYLTTASRNPKENKGHWREIRGLDSHPQTLPHSASVFCFDGATSLSEGQKSYCKMCLWSIDKMQTHQNVFSFSIPFLKWNIMVSFRLGAAMRCQWEVRNNSNKFIFLPEVLLAAWGSTNQRQITKVWISSVQY